MIIKNKKLHDLIVMKDVLVTEGRGMTGGLEALEKKVRICEDKEKKITGSIPPDPILKAKGDELIELFNKTLKEIEVIGKQIEKAKMDAIPKELLDEHKGYLKEIEVIERNRNKIALKVQKVKDRIIPLVQKEVKPLLGEYDDIETAKAKDGEVIVTTFNHLNDWKSKFKSRQS